MNEELQAALKAVVERAAVDADFRAKYQADPRRVLKETTGVEAPEDFAAWPKVPDEDEITEEELNQVAGGRIFSYNKSCDHTCSP